MADLRATWLDLAVTDLLYKLVAVLLLTPLAGAVWSLSLWLGGADALADQEILYFALSPIGLLGLLISAAVSLAVLALGQACLMTIGLTAAQNHQVSQLDAVRHALRRAPAVLGLTARLVGKVLLLAAPFLAAAGVIYLWLLTDFDINYYLTEQPPVWWVALALGALLVAGLAALLVPRVIGWSLSLPIIVVEGRDAAEAMALSAERTGGHRRAITQLLVGWGVLAVLLSSVATGLVAMLGRMAAPTAQGSLGVAVTLMFAVVILWVLTSVAVTFVQNATFALLVSRLYLAVGRADTSPEVSDAVRREPPGRLDALLPKRLSMGGMVGVVAVAAVATAAIWAGVLAALDVDRGIAVIAHRGSSQAAPENTMAAVRAAVEDGTDYVEIDVQTAADGQVVVVHDGDLMKIGGVPLGVSDTATDELQDVDIGSWFDPRFASERVPLLVDVLEACRDRARVVIELKYYGPNEALAPAVIDIVEAAGMVDQVALMSLDGDAVAQVRQLRPDWRVGLLAATALGDLTRVDADFLAVSTGLATADLAGRAADRGMDLYVWTVNDPVQMVRMLTLGVDGLITDVPARARTVIEDAREMHPVERLLVATSYLFGAAAPDPPVENDLPPT